MEAKAKKAQQSNFLEFDHFLVCTVDFKPQVSFEQRTTKVQDLSLSGLFKSE